MRMNRVMRSVMMVMVLWAVAGSSAACARIGGGYVGIKVNMSGDARGVQDTPARTGWFFYNPIASDVYKYPTFVQSAVLTKEDTPGSPNDDSITFLVEKMAVNADVGFSFSIQPDKVPAFWVKFRTDEIDEFTHGYMKALLRDEFNHAAGRYTLDDVLGDNNAFLAEVKSRLQTVLGPYGVVMEDQFGFIGALRPPADVTTAINAKVQATLVAAQKQNELAQAEADAAKKVAEMQGWATAIKLESEAQAEANRILAASLTPNLIELKRIEKWNGAYPQAVGGGAVPLLTIK